MAREKFISYLGYRHEGLRVHRHRDIMLLLSPPCPSQLTRLTYVVMHRALRIPFLVRARGCNTYRRSTVSIKNSKHSPSVGALEAKRKVHIFFFFVKTGRLSSTWPDQRRHRTGALIPVPWAHFFVCQRPTGAFSPDVVVFGLSRCASVHALGTAWVSSSSVVTWHISPSTTRASFDFPP